MTQVTHDEAETALDDMDDYARMNLGVDACGPRTALERYITQQRAKEAASAKLVEALQMLHDDIADYAKINNLGGYDNHCMKLARTALAAHKEAQP